MTPEYLSVRKEPSKGRRWVNRAAIFTAGAAVGVAGTLGVQTISKYHIEYNDAQAIKPGGVWESPQNGVHVGDIIHFAARAYPTHQGDPPVAYVNFTAGINGAWQIACHVPPQPQTQEASCDWAIPEPVSKSGQKIIVSFDVYDQKGNVNKAPNGEHTVFEN